MTKETVTELSGFINKISEKIGKSLSDFTEKFITKINMVMATEYMRDFFAALQQFSLDIENNPDSYFNYMRYQKNLDNMHWAWPYEIKTEELKSLLENAHNEKEFDTLMKFFFKEEKIDKMVQEMLTLLPDRHKMMLKQAKNAFDRGDYAIANNALMSIIDNALSEYLENKGQNKRVGIFQPIINHYEGFAIGEVDFIFELCMLSNNINFIFQDCSFDKKIEIKTNKKVRRHTSLHGVRYSNKRIDTLLLFNTLVNVLKQQSLLCDYRNSLIWDRRTKKFKFSSIMQKKLDEKQCIDLILFVIQQEGKVDHKTLLKHMDNVFPEDIENKGKYLSKLLQKMKSSKNGITCQTIDGKNIGRLRSMYEKMMKLVYNVANG